MHLKNESHFKKSITSTSEGKILVKYVAYILWTRYFFLKNPSKRVNKVHWHLNIPMSLSDSKIKVPQKFFQKFRLFLSLCRTASRPYRLSHINALHINQYYYSKDQSMKFLHKIFENWRFWKSQFFWVSNFNFFFASFPWKSVQIYMVEWMGRNFDVFPGFQKIPCYA